MVKASEIDTMILYMKSHINNKTDSSFKVDTNLNTRNLANILKQTDKIESEVKQDFQQKLLRLEETRDKLRNQIWFSLKKENKPHNSKNKCQPGRSKGQIPRSLSLTVKGELYDVLFFLLDLFLDLFESKWLYEYKIR